MKIEKAIEILKELPDNVNNVLDYDQQGAVKLGIEALKLIKSTHENSGMSFGATLLGETED